MNIDQDPVSLMKQWARDNYENGADTFVECWSTKDYEELLNDHEGNLGHAMATLEACASIYLDRQANARNEQF